MKIFFLITSLSLSLFASEPKLKFENKVTENIVLKINRVTFESKEVAEKFAEIWNNKRDEYIDKTIGEDPHGDYEFNYIKAKAIQLELSGSTKKLLEEISTIQ